MGIVRPSSCADVVLLSRRALTLLCAAAVVTGVARAEVANVPLPLQAKLCSKVLQYDKNFRRRAHDRVRVVILHDSRTADSQHAAVALKYAFEEIGTVAGIPVSVVLFEFRDAAEVRAKVDGESATVVYLTPGLGERAAAISAALAGADVLSVSALAADVKEGVVLGFDLVSSQPKLWVNLTAAQRQNVAFEPQALKLMKVLR